MDFLYCEGVILVLALKALLNPDFDLKLASSAVMARNDSSPAPPKVYPTRIVVQKGWLLKKQGPSLKS